MVLKAKYPAIILVLLLVGLVGYFAYRKITSVNKSPVLGNVSTLSPDEQYREQYLEFLKAVLILNVKVKKDTAWIYITNRSPIGVIPSEEPNRVLVCTTELIALDNKPIGSYPEYFKMAPLDNISSQQIAPATTVKFGYDLTIPHGIIRVKLTYEDFSMAWRGEIPVILLAEKEIKF